MRIPGVRGEVSDAMFTATALSVASTMPSPSANASVVMYDNRAGVFEWKLSIDYNDAQDELGTFLDITQPPTQNGEYRSGSFGQWYNPNMSSSEPGLRGIYGIQTGATARTTNAVELAWNDTTIFVYPTREYLSGESVSKNDSWIFGSTYFYYEPWHDDFAHGTPAISTLAYIGVRLKVSNSARYGWILLKDYTTPIMWAYETKIGVPISIPVPAPSPCVIACFTAMISLQRRRGTSPLPHGPARA